MKYLLYGAAILVFSAAIFAPLFLSDKVVFDGDALTYDYPALAFYEKSIDTHQSLDWNPYYISGFPTKISPVGDYLDPVNRTLLHLHLDSFSTLHFRLVLSIALGLLFAILFARFAGLSEGAALVVALAYLVAQTLTGLIAALVMSGTFFVLPMLLYFILLIHKGKSFPLVTALGALILGYAWLSGFVQIVFYCVIFAGVYALYLSYSNREGRWYVRLRPLLSLAIIVAGSVVVALPALIGTLDFRHLTPRVGGFGANLSETMEVGEIMHFLFPYYLSIPYVVGGFVPGLYFGALAFFLALVGVVHLNRIKDLHAPFFLYAYAAIFLFASTWFGLSKIIQHLPVFSTFHTLTRALMPGSFFLAYVAGYGYDVLSLRLFSEVRLKRLVFASSIFLAVLLAFFLIVNGCFAYCGLERPENIQALLKKVFTYLGKDSSRLTTNSAYYSTVFELLVNRVKDAYSLLNWRFSLPLFFLFSSVAIIYAYMKDTISRRVFTLFAIGSLALNVFIVYAAEFDKYIPKAEVVREPVISKIIHADPVSLGGYLSSFLVGDASFRLTSLSHEPTPSEHYALMRETMTQNTNVYSGISRADGYEPYLTVRQKHLWADIIANETLVVGSRTVEDAVAQKKKEFLSLLPLLSSYSISYIVSGYPLVDPRLKEAEVQIPVDFPLHLYKNTAALPGVYIPQDIEVVKEWSDSYFAEINAKVGAPTAYVECSSCALSTTFEHQSGKISKTTYANTRVSFHVDAAKPVWVVISRSNLPDWKASVDGAETPIYAANYVLQAIRVDAGSHDVVLTYEPKAPIDGFKALIGGK